MILANFDRGLTLPDAKVSANAPLIATVAEAAGLGGFPKLYR
jgi:hypothetical protein